MRIHNIVVAHGVAERCKKHFGGSGTLMYNSQIKGPMHCDPQNCAPFQVGVIDNDASFVHVLDDVSVEIALHSRDTITDFVDYLRTKEDFVQSLADRGIPLIVTGEEELLAKYMMAFNGEKHALKAADQAKVVVVEEGYWAHFTNSPQTPGPARSRSDQLFMGCSD
jgi:hypothetical protein